MNYRHSFHAGNVADVLKHIVLIHVLRALHKKETPFCVLDTHAGSGVYALGEKGEFEQGIAALWSERDQWQGLRDYFAVIEGVNEEGRLIRYPGSPVIIRNYLRPQDRAVFVELQPEEYQTLKANFSDAVNVCVHHVDAWSGLKGFVPPRENRGVVLIDPPYEVANEFDRVLTAVRQGIKHWRTGYIWCGTLSSHVI